MPIEITEGEPDGLVGRIRKLSMPMEPLATGVEPHLPRLGEIRAVLFDIYGTLFISGSGDVGTHAATDSTAALAEAMHAVGLSSSDELAERGIELLHLTITESHEQRQAEGVERPEVDIREIWRRVFDRLADEGMLAPDAEVVRRKIEPLAVEYECRVNPVWPMPHLADVLDELQQWVALGDLMLGIVSNAQFITPLLFDALLRRSPEAFGFDPALCNWSYQLLEAKPSTQLYEPIAQTLRTHSIQPSQVLYVGNDRRNDIWPASQVGFRTALFAGDKRSLRMRDNDAALVGVKPDAIITELPQLLSLLRGA
ncbi:MAG: HAD family hydrolase [Phycisphaeraceae bacterium]